MPITEIDARLKYRNASGDTTVIYPITKADNIDGTFPITKGGTGATTAAAALINLGITATATELNYVDGVTSDIQTQLNDKAASSHNHPASNITSGTLSSDRLPIVPIVKGGTGASNAATSRANLGAAPAFTYGTADISAGSTSSEADGTMHFVYTTKNGVWNHVKSIFITVDGVWRLVWAKSYSITTNLTNVTAITNVTEVLKNGTATLAFTANSGYTLPDTISVSGATSSWNKSTGKLILSNPTDNIVVTIAGVSSAATTYSITTNLTNITVNSGSSSPDTIQKDGMAAFFFVCSEGYDFPETITVTNADYNWYKDMGYMTLYNPTGNVTVTIAGKPQSYAVTYQLTNCKLNSGTETATYRTDYSAIILPDSGYNLPSNPIVTIGSEPYTGYEWNAVTGSFKIPGSDITGTVLITVICSLVDSDVDITGDWLLNETITEVSFLAEDPTHIGVIGSCYVYDSYDGALLHQFSGLDLGSSYFILKGVYDDKTFSNTYYVTEYEAGFDIDAAGNYIETTPVNMSGVFAHIAKTSTQGKLLRTFTITGGADVKNGALINWLRTNATRPAYSITTNLAGVTALGSNPTTISYGGSATLTFTANLGRTLPEVITVTGATYSWNNNTGKLTLSNPTGDVSIRINAFLNPTEN